MTNNNPRSGEDQRRKVALIIPDEGISNSISEYFGAHWNTQTHVPYAAHFWDAVDKQQIDAERTDIIITVDAEYTIALNANDQDGLNTYIQTLAAASQGACVIVLTLDENATPHIKLAIRNAQQELNFEQKEVFFVAYENALTYIPETVNFYDNAEKLIADEQRASAETHEIVVEAEESGTSVDTSHDAIVITSTSSKGGSGKSTVALLLATQIALSCQKGGTPLKVCVVDLDIFDSQVGFTLGTTRPNALSVAVSSEPFGPELIAKNMIFNERMGVSFLLAAPRGDIASLTSKDFYLEVIAVLKTMFDIVILDTSVQHFDEIIKGVALPVADLVLVVSTLDMRSLQGTSRWLDNALKPRDKGGHGLQKNNLGIVINNSLNDVGVDKRMIEIMSRDVRRLVSIPLDTHAVISATNALRMEDVVLTHPKIGAAYFELAQRVTKPFKDTINLVPLIGDAPAKPEAAPQETTKTTRGKWFGGGK